MNENSNQFNKFTLPLFWFFAFFVIIFMITQTVNAAEPVEPSYPLYIDSEMNPTDISLEEIKSAYSLMWGDLPENYIIYCNSIDQSYKNGPHGWDYYDYYNFIVAVDPIFDYPITLDINSSYYYITNTVEYSFNYYTHSSSFSAFQVNSNVRSQKAYYYIAQGLGYILYGTEEEYTSTADVVVWAYRHNDPVINTGVAVAPPNFIVPEYFTGDSAPTAVPPSYTINNYTWTNAPSFDGSTVINGIQSIKDTLEWLADNLKNSISNLLTNLKGLAEYIGKTIQYYGNAIIETINNAIQNFYDNMVSLIQPIFEKIAYITEEVNTDEIDSALEDTSFIGLKNQFITFFTTFESAFDISEPSTFTLTINIQNIDIFYNFGCRSPVIIHLDDHFSPIKNALRTFLWIFISFGTVFVVERGLSDWLRGENDTK